MCSCDCYRSIGCDIFVDVVAAVVGAVVVLGKAIVSGCAIGAMVVVSVVVAEFVVHGEALVKTRGTGNTLQSIRNMVSYLLRPSRGR